jgi:UDP-N-acetylglucosamine 2-epimerase (non-hydrolysing)
MYKMKKYLFIFGTRPEAIKMVPVILEFKKNINITTKVCITAQHREMLDQVLDFFEIKPDFDLNLMMPNQTLNQLAGKMFLAIDEIYKKEVFDTIFVHGDTLTSSICAWAAFHRKINIGHIEAGLRTYNKLSPFPEEMNRQITGRLADFHFAPTNWTKKNLISEGVNPNAIEVTGNTVIDALMIGLQKISSGYKNEDIIFVEQLINPTKKIILITGHRRENFGEGFENLCQAIKQLACREDIQIIYPVHLNPNVQEPVNRILNKVKNIHLIKPLDYPSFIYLMSKSYIILTDSGGIQEEAPALGKPVLVMRDTTERPEALEVGTVKLVGTNTNTIVDQTINLLENDEMYKSMTKLNNPYGDGNAAQLVLNFILNLNKLMV